MVQRNLVGSLGRRARGAVFAALLPCLFGCSSSTWSRSTVDGASLDAGAYLSMHYWRDQQQNKQLSIVYEDRTNRRIRIAERRGVGASWQPFSLQTISSQQAKLPASTIDSNGALYVTFVNDHGPLPRSTIYVVHRNQLTGQWLTSVVFGYQTPGQGTDEPAAIAVRSNGVEINVVWSERDTKRLLHARRGAGSTSAFSWEELMVDKEQVYGARPAFLPTASFNGWALYYQARRTQFGEPAGIVWRSITPLGLWTPAEQVLGTSADPSKVRFHAKTITAENAPGSGGSAIAFANCEGKPRYRRLQSPLSEDVTPPIPTDQARQYCDPSFTHDHKGRLYMSAYDVQARSAVVFYVDPGPEQWVVDFAEGTPNDVGRYSSIVYDPLADTLMLAYYDATNGDLKLATRRANSK